MSNGEGDHVVVELVTSTSINNTNDSSSSPLADEIAPLLTVESKPKVNIFTLSYSKRKPKDEMMKSVEAEVSMVQFGVWAWSGSKYSGLICMALSCTIYSIMEAISYAFPVNSIALFETIFTRCTIVSVLSLFWLRRTGQPVFGPTHVRSLLLSRALVGYLSLFGFVYSLQRLPLSQAMILNLTTPIMASLAARIILQEKINSLEVAGLLCGFIGLLFILQPMLKIKGELAENGELNTTQFLSGIHHFFYLLVGLLSSVTGGISYCLVRAGAKASDQSVVTVFAFSLMACPLAAICTFFLEDFVLPDIYSFIIMVVLGVLAFFAEVFLARGLQLEKTSRVTNMHYIEPFLSQIWGFGLSRIRPSFGGLFGCFLILVSVGSTLYFGPEKEME